MQTLRSLSGLALAYISFVFISTIHAGPTDNIPQTLKVKGGFVVHLGCGDGTLTTALRSGEQFQVHGLALAEDQLEAARSSIKQQGVYGPVAVDMLHSTRLPYIDNLVNLLETEMTAKQQAALVEHRRIYRIERRRLRPRPGPFRVADHSAHRRHRGRARRPDG